MGKERSGTGREEEEEEVEEEKEEEEDKKEDKKEEISVEWIDSFNSRC